MTLYYDTGLGFRGFVTTYKRQHALAERMGLRVIDPANESP